MRPLEAEATDVVEAIDRRLGAGRKLRSFLRYVFPEHWSFLLGEIALYAFIVLLATGTYLALFFTPDTGSTLIYHGPFAAVQGLEVTPAYDSALSLSSVVPAGLLMRQTHHWAALVFVAAMIVHLMRVFFTGAFRRPREAIWLLGVALLAMGILEGFAGYSLPDDLLSGMGLVIAYGVALSIPWLGGSVGSVLWDGQYPGTGAIESRLFIAHVFILPGIMAALIGLHLALVMRHHHTQFRGPGAREDNVVGAPMWPAYALRATGLMLATAAVLVALGGLVQINPIFQYGPYELNHSTNGAQPDWYLGWLIGALRLMPPIEITGFGRTLIPNPFFGGVLFPGAVFGVLFGWPWIERRLTRDRAVHHLLDRPRDRPWRTAFGAAFFAWVAVIFVAGSADRMFLSFGVPYEREVDIFRALALIVPFTVLVVVRRACEQLRRGDARPGLGAPAQRVRRRADGSFGADDAA